MCIKYILFHNCKYSRIRNLSRRNTRNVIKGWWAFQIQLCVQGFVWVKGKPNWKEKHPAKSHFILSSCLQSEFMFCLVQCFMLLVWWGFGFFFFDVFITSFKSSKLFFGPLYLVDSSTFSVLAPTPGKPEHSHRGFYLLSDPAFLGKHNWKVLHTPMISLQDCNSSHANTHLISVNETSNSVIQTALKGFLQICDITEI